MKRFFLFYAFLLTFILCPAQRSEVSVCGIKMGTNREVAKRILEDRYGRYSVSEESGSLSILNGYAGGLHHKFMTFDFAWINGESKFNGATFSTPYELNEQKLAIEKRELLKSLYEGKYELREKVNDDGFKEYYFGESYYGEYGVITIFKSKSKDGKTRLYVDVYYFGPYNETDDI